MRKPNISIFFPAYNEAENLPLLIKRADKVLRDVADKYEMIIVNYEGSSDNTEETVAGLREKYRNLRLVSQPLNRKGIGEAIRIGFVNSSYEHIFYTDADNQFDIREIKKFIPLITKYDVIAAYKKKRNDPLPRIIISAIYNFIIRVVFNIPYKDVDCAFRYVNKRVIDALTLKCVTGVATTELLVKAKKKGFKIKQIPVTHYPRLYGQPVFVSGTNIPRLRVIKQLVREIITLKKELRELDI